MGNLHARLARLESARTEPAEPMTEAQVERLTRTLTRCFGPGLWARADEISEQVDLDVPLAPLAHADVLALSCEGRKARVTLILAYATARARRAAQTTSQERP